MPQLGDMPDSAYGLGYEYQEPKRNRGIHHMDPNYDPTPGEHYDEANELALDKDEASGYNWGPPPGDHDSEPPVPDELDDWPDPDHGREAGHYDDYDQRANDMEYNLAQEGDSPEAEEHRVGAILTQAQQWPDRAAANVGGHGHTEGELDATSHGMQHHDDIKIMRGKDTGLYGEDEDHPQDIIGQPNSHGGFDVLRHLN